MHTEPETSKAGGHGSRLSRSALGRNDADEMLLSPLAHLTSPNLDR